LSNKGNLHWAKKISAQADLGCSDAGFLWCFLESRRSLLRGCDFSSRFVVDYRHLSFWKYAAKYSSQFLTLFGIALCCGVRLRRPMVQLLVPCLLSVDEGTSKHSQPHGNGAILLKLVLISSACYIINAE